VVTKSDVCLVALVRADDKETEAFGTALEQVLHRLEGLADRDQFRWYELVRFSLVWALYRRPRPEREQLIAAAQASQSNVARFAIAFWPAVDADAARNAARRRALEALNRWRSAIAYSASTAAMMKGRHPSLHLAKVQESRRACDSLARSFDNVMHAHPHTGVVPW
jgi:hypothetical protein